MEYKYCENCGSRNENNKNKCFHCGNDLNIKDSVNIISGKDIEDDLKKEGFISLYYRYMSYFIIPITILYSIKAELTPLAILIIVLVSLFKSIKNNVK